MAPCPTTLEARAGGPFFHSAEASKRVKRQRWIAPNSPWLPQCPDFMSVQAQIFFFFYSLTSTLCISWSVPDKSVRTLYTFLCRSWLIVSQTIEGADVILFVMNFLEYGNASPPPNQGLVCIALIDSVRHMRPRIKG